MMCMIDVISQGKGLLACCAYVIKASLSDSKITCSSPRSSDVCIVLSSVVASAMKGERAKHNHVLPTTICPLGSLPTMANAVHPELDKKEASTLIFMKPGGGLVHREITWFLCVVHTGGVSRSRFGVRQYSRNIP
ncbi:hypothetical protein SLA2020_290990 [Shorea laevis]